MFRGSLSQRLSRIMPIEVTQRQHLQLFLNVFKPIFDGNPKKMSNFAVGKPNSNQPQTKQLPTKT